MDTMNPIHPFIDRYGAFVLDGGLATQLEAHGQDLSDELWSARLLLEAKQLMQLLRLHLRASRSSGAMLGRWQPC